MLKWLTRAESRLDEIMSVEESGRNYVFLIGSCIEYRGGNYQDTGDNRKYLVSMISSPEIQVTHAEFIGTARNKRLVTTSTTPWARC